MRNSLGVKRLDDFSFVNVKFVVLLRYFSGVILNVVEYINFEFRREICVRGTNLVVIGIEIEWMRLFVENVKNKKRSLEV